MKIRTLSSIHAPGFYQRCLGRHHTVAKDQSKGKTEDQSDTRKHKASQKIESVLLTCCSLSRDKATNPNLRMLKIPVKNFLSDASRLEDSPTTPNHP